MLRVKTYFDLLFQSSCQFSIWFKLTIKHKKAPTCRCQCCIQFVGSCQVRSSPNKIVQVMQIACASCISFFKILALGVAVGMRKCCKVQEHTLVKATEITA
jgi:hypothetical protein